MKDDRGDPNIKKVDQVMKQYIEDILNINENILDVINCLFRERLSDKPRIYSRTVVKFLNYMLYTLINFN